MKVKAVEELQNEILQLRKEISQLKNENDALRINKQQLLKLTKVVEQNPTTILITDVNGIIEYVNPYFTTLTGYQKEEVIGKNPSVLSSGKQTPEFYKTMWETIKSGKVWDGEFLNKKKNGELYWESAVIGPIVNEEGNIKNFIACKIDITGQKRTEEELIASKAEIESIFRSTPIGIGVVKNRVFEFVNDMFCEMVGYKREELIGKNSRFIYPGNEEYEAVGKIAYIKNEKYDSTKFETRLKRNNGEIIDILLSSSPIDASDFSKGVTFSATDITNRKRAERVLRESEEKFRILAEYSPNMIFINQHGRIAYVNKRCVEVSGYSKEEFYSEDFDYSSLIVPEHRQSLLNNFNAHMEGREIAPYEYSILTKSGKTLDVIISTNLINYGGDKAILGIITDITARKMIERQLIESERKLRTVINNLPGMAYRCLLDENWTMLFVSHGCVDLTGYEANELINNNKVSYKSIIHTEDRERIRKEVEELSGTGKQFELVYRIVKKSGDIRWVWERGLEVDKGNESGPVLEGIVEDITEKKISEKKIQDSHIRLRNLAERLQMIREEERATVAREIHDDLGQVLTALKMDVSWFRKNPFVNEEELISKTDKMLELINSTIQTVKRISTELRPGILDDLGLFSAIEWQTEEFKKRTSIDCVLDINDDNCLINDNISINVFRIFQETLTNITRHSQASKVNIKFGCAGSRLMLEVEDNGIGISENNANSYKSLGIIGMRERVNLLNGQLEITGKKEQGTKVKIIIPLNTNIPEYKPEY